MAHPTELFHRGFTFSPVPMGSPVGKLPGMPGIHAATRRTPASVGLVEPAPKRSSVQDVAVR